MGAPASTITAEELLQYRNEPYRHELIDGRLHEMEPTGFEHGAVAARVVALLTNHADARDLGTVLSTEAGFLLVSDPDTVRAADAAFVFRERVEAAGRQRGYWPGPPDLAVEVVSPGDRGPQVEAKALDWLAAGTRAVVVLEPDDRTAVVHRDADVQRLAASDTLDLDDVLPGFSIPLAELFT